MTDEELIGYTEFHCRTDRALFHREHVLRMYVLAGRAMPADLPEWVAWHSYDGASDICREARARQALAPTPPPQEEESPA